MQPNRPKRSRLFFVGALALGLGVLAGPCFGADGDERFLGGCYDGYDLRTLSATTIQSAIPKGTIVSICYNSKSSAEFLIICFLKSNLAIAWIAPTRRVI